MRRFLYLLNGEQAERVEYLPETATFYAVVRLPSKAYELTKEDLRSLLAFMDAVEKDLKKGE